MANRPYPTHRQSVDLIQLSIMGPIATEQIVSAAVESGFERVRKRETKHLQRIGSNPKPRKTTPDGFGGARGDGSSSETASSFRFPFCSEWHLRRDFH